jgi:transglutaminase/protease-like cytokinesis protein 3
MLLIVPVKGLIDIDRRMHMNKKVIALIMIILCMTWPIEASAQTYTTQDDVYANMKNNLIAHKKEFIIEMDKEIMKEIGTDTNMFDIVAARDDKATSKDGDYLSLSISHWASNWSWSNMGNTATLVFSAKYRTTLTQEKILDTKIASVLEALKLEKASDYKKVKAIHDYIIKRVSYDKTLKKHTAYNALINESSVCEGYALAAYRMFTDAGIENRIIIGMAGGGSHAWNIVKVDDNWYNIDITWDDPITSSGEQVLRYGYFLKNAKEFSDHKRDPEYNTKAFLKAYPIAKTSYESK